MPEFQKYSTEIFIFPSYFQRLRDGSPFMLRGILYIKVDPRFGVEPAAPQFMAAPGPQTEVLCRRCDVLENTL